MLPDLDLAQFIDAALKEDVEKGDHTSLSCIPPEKSCKAHIIAKEDGIIAGIEVAGKVLERVDPGLEIDLKVSDGDAITEGDQVVIINGNARSILKAERLVLNFMQRMSGIATLTGQYVKAVSGYPTQILDTRKTTPLFRHFEKLAVRIGGGVNHRMGLYDMIMIKDNHIAYSGGMEQAISRVRNYLASNSLNLKVEIEAANLEQVKEILTIGGVNRIMLDNFSTSNTREAVELINRKFETESSGGINLNNVREYAACGVDFISVGALTHSAKNLDLSLQALT